MIVVGFLRLRPRSDRLLRRPHRSAPVRRRHLGISGGKKVIGVGVDREPRRSRARNPRVEALDRRLIVLKLELNLRDVIAKLVVLRQLKTVGVERRLEIAQRARIILKLHFDRGAHLVGRRLVDTASCSAARRSACSISSSAACILRRLQVQKFENLAENFRRPPDQASARACAAALRPLRSRLPAPQPAPQRRTSLRQNAPDATAPERSRLAICFLSFISCRLKRTIPNLRASDARQHQPSVNSKVIAV